MLAMRGAQSFPPACVLTSDRAGHACLFSYTASTERHLEPNHTHFLVVSNEHFKPATSPARACVALRRQLLSAFADHDPEFARTIQPKNCPIRNLYRKPKFPHMLDFTCQVGTLQLVIGGDGKPTEDIGSKHNTKEYT